MSHSKPHTFTPEAVITGLRKPLKKANFAGNSFRTSNQQQFLRFEFSDGSFAVMHIVATIKGRACLLDNSLLLLYLIQEYRVSFLKRNGFATFVGSISKLSSRRLLEILSLFTRPFFRPVLRFGGELLLNRVKKGQITKNRDDFQTTKNFFVRTSKWWAEAGSF